MNVASSDSALGFLVLGPLEVRRDGRRAAAPRSPLLRRLLAALLVAEGAPVPVPRLLRLVWGTDAGRRGAVQVAVTRLRRWLEESGGRAEWVVHGPHGYRLAIPDAAVDVGRFRALVAEATAVDGEDRLRCLHAALTLRRGPVLADLAGFDRTEPHVRDLENLLRSVALDLAGLAFALDHPDVGLDEIDALAESYPLDEELHACVIKGLAAAGRPAAALRHFATLRSQLAEELGVEPAENVRRTFLEVLSRDGEATVPAVRPAQLPRDLADFTGREDDAAALVRALTVPAPRAVPVIVGMAGTGKTTLAVHVAHRLAGSYPDGQLYVDLRGTERTPVAPADALWGFLTALGVHGPAMPAAEADRAALARTLLSDRRVLVVLDNAADEAQVRPLLPGSSRSAALVTSRMALSGLEGASAHDLRPFSAEQSLALLGRIVGRDRVSAEPETARTLVDLCENLPLAVRIAGARVAGRPHRTLTGMVRALEDEHRRLDVLAVGDLAVRAGLSLGYQRLGPDLQRTFRLLALAPGDDVGVWLAAALLDVPPATAEDRLELLADRHLLEIAGTGADGLPRYGFHDLVRLYARERLAAEETVASRRAAEHRVLGTALWLAERAADGVPGPCYALLHGPASRRPMPELRPADPTAWFDAEYRILIAAVWRACDLGLVEHAWDLAGCLERHLDLRGYADVWEDTHRGVLELVLAAGDRLGEAVLRRGLAEVTTWSGSDADASAMEWLHDEATAIHAIFAELGERRGMADAHVMATWGLVAQGRKDDAVAAAAAGLRLAEEAGHLGGCARAHHVAAIAQASSPAVAIDHLEQALEFVAEVGNLRFEATLRQFLGAFLCLEGRTAEGVPMLEATIETARELEDEYLEVFSLIYLGRAYAAAGDERAGPLAARALEIAHRNRYPHHVADSLQLAGELDLRDGRPEIGRTRLEEAVRLWRARGWLSFLASALVSLGRACAAAAGPSTARRHWQEARELYEQIGDDKAVRRCDALLAGQDGEGTGVQDSDDEDADDEERANAS